MNVGDRMFDNPAAKMLAGRVLMVATIDPFEIQAIVTSAERAREVAHPGEAVVVFELDHDYHKVGGEGFPMWAVGKNGEFFFGKTGEVQTVDQVNAALVRHMAS